MKAAQFPTLPMGATAVIGAEIASKFGWSEVPPQEIKGLWREYRTPFGQLTDMGVANHFIKLAHAFNTEDIEQIRIVLTAVYNVPPIDKGTSYGV